MSPKRLGINVSFEQNSKIQFIAVRYNVPKKEEQFEIMNKKVILISIDGMRPDGLKNCSSEAVEFLKSKASYTFNAKTVYPSITLPALSLCATASFQIHMYRRFIK